MQSPTTNLEANAAAVPPALTRKVITEPDFSGEPQPIGTLTERADFPQCALGVHVNIRGFAGVVVEIVKQSIVVLASDGTAQRFNAYRLKALFAPPERPTPPPAKVADRPRPAALPPPFADEPKAAPPVPVRVFIDEPDFTLPLHDIKTFASRRDFPQCAYGQHVDIPGYAGVVVEIVKGSLKVQSPTGDIRSYNAAVLKRLYGQG